MVMDKLDAKKLDATNKILERFANRRNTEKGEVCSDTPQKKCQTPNTDHDNTVHLHSPDSMDAVIKIASAAAAEANEISAMQGGPVLDEQTINNRNDAHAANCSSISCYEPNPASASIQQCTDQDSSVAPLQIIPAVSFHDEQTGVPLSSCSTEFITCQATLQTRNEECNLNIQKEGQSDGDSTNSRKECVEPTNQSENSENDMQTKLQSDCVIEQQNETFKPDTTFEDDSVVQISDSPSTAKPDAIKDILPLRSPIHGGQSFIDPGSVSTAIKSRAKRYGQTEDALEGYTQLVKSSNKIDPLAAKTYKEHVQLSNFRITRRTDSTELHQKDTTKIRICGASVTEKEFVHSLMPRGQIDLNFMWLCCVAISRDWCSRTKLILNQPMIRELTRSFEACDHDYVTRRLQNFALHEIEQIYLPICTNGHWILIVVNIAAQSTEIYDSLKSVKKGDHPYRSLWVNVGSNLQHSYNSARKDSFPIYDNFRLEYPRTQKQTNSHDCGYHVLRLLECHNGKDLIGYGKVNMVHYRMKVAHILIYHRLNDLNPLRSVPMEK